MKNKFICYLCILVVCIMCIHQSYAAASNANPLDPIETGIDFTVKGISYKIIDSGKKYVSTVQGTSPYKGKIVIPDEVTYNNVTYKITKVSGFIDSPDVTDITIPRYVTCISGFYGAPNEYNGNGTGIKAPALATSSKLQTVRFNAENCEKAYYYYHTTTMLGGVVGGEQTVFPSTVTTVIFGDKVQRIPMGLFKYCSKIKELKFPKSVKYIYRDIIGLDYDNLTKCTFLCEDLQELDWMPVKKSVVSLGSDFHTFPYSEDKVYNAESPYSPPVSQPTVFLKYMNLDKETTKDLILPSWVHKIADRVFSGFKCIENLTLGENVTVIGNEAFQSCSALKSLTIGEKVTVIGNEAFQSCSALKNLTLGKNVTEIGSSAFQYCSALKNLTLGENVNTIGRSAFGSIRFENVYCKAKVPPTVNSSFSYISSTTLYVPAGTKEKYLSCHEWCDFGTIVDGLKNFTYTYKGQTLKYTIIDEDGKKACTQHGTSDSSGNNVSGAVFIPEKVSDGTNEYTVTEIGNFAFKNCDGLTSISIPNTVTDIGEEAYSGCSELTEATIGNSVTRIGYKAFNECISLANISIGNSVETIDDYAFYQCKELANVIISNSVKTIGNYAFSECSALKNVCLGNSVKTIGDNAFSRCSELANITIGNSVTNIGQRAFYNCTELKEVNLGNSVKAISDHMFSYCPSLTSIEIPNSTVSIGTEAFLYCYSLITATIGESVEAIGDKAFNGCYSLGNVYCKTEVPPSATNSFDSNISKATLSVPTGTSSAYTASEGWRDFGTIVEFVEYTHNEQTLRFVIQNEEAKVVGAANSFEPGILIIPEKIEIANKEYPVTRIGKNAFCNRNDFTTVTIGNSVKEIDDTAFLNCGNLTSVTIGNSVEKISATAFDGCNKMEILYFNAENCTECGRPGNSPFPPELKELEIGEKVKIIPEYSFYYCSNLETVTIPESVILIGDEAFYGCNGLKILYFNAEDCIVYKDSHSWYWYPIFPKSLKQLVIGENVKTIHNYAFSSCDELDVLYFNAENCQNCGGEAFPYYTKQLVIGDMVKSIPDNAFENCRALTSVKIGNSVTKIGDSVFGDCENLRSLTIPESVVSIGKYAFWGCIGLDTLYFNAVNCEECGKDGGSPFPRYQLKNLIIGDKVTTIPRNAFALCKQLESIVIPNSVITIGDRSFWACERLTSVSIGSSVVTIGSNSFDGCHGLTSIEIPNSVKVIGSASFYECFNLTSVTIGSSVTEIGDRAFCYCSSLNNFYCKALVPPVFGTNPFNYTPQNNLYIPRGTKELYASANTWRDFINIIEFDYAGVENATINNNEDRIDFLHPYEVYSLSGIRIGNSIDGLPSGCYIIRQNKLVKKIII